MSEVLGEPWVPGKPREDPANPSAWCDDALQVALRKEQRSLSALSSLFKSLYRLRGLRNLITRLCLRLESGPLFTRTMREILHLHHGVVVGEYSYGDILKPGILPPGSKVGRYCSVGCELIVRRRDHPVDRICQSPLFYNHMLGLVRRDTIPEDRDNPLVVGNDVWIGDRVTILSGCKQIGNGAVVAAGAVVTQTVEPYSIVGGVPAKLLRKRYSPAVEQRLERSRWWQLSVHDLLEIAPALLTSAESIDQQTLDNVRRKTSRAVRK